LVDDVANALDELLIMLKLLEREGALALLKLPRVIDCEVLLFPFVFVAEKMAEDEEEDAECCGE